MATPSKSHGKGPRKPQLGRHCPKCHRGILVRRVTQSGPNAGKAYRACNRGRVCGYFQRIEDNH